MKLEMRNARIHDDMSEETICFTGDLYIDGELAANVSNSGKGEAHRMCFDDGDLEEAFNKYCESLPDRVITWLTLTGEECMTLKSDAELVINDLIKGEYNGD